MTSSLLCSTAGVQSLLTRVIINEGCMTEGWLLGGVLLKFNKDDFLSILVFYWVLLGQPKTMFGIM